MTPPRDELAELKERVKQLEGRIRSLRAGRRVLMNLLAAQERSRRAQILRLEQENHRLQRRSSRWAQVALARNLQIMRMPDTHP